MKTKKALALLLALVFVFSLAPAAFADDDTADVPSPLPDLYDDIELSIADFEESANGFTSLYEGAAMYIVNDPERGKAATVGADEEGGTGFSCDPVSPLDLFSYETFGFAYYIAPEWASDGDFYADVILFSDNEKREYTEKVSALGWNDLSFDISGLGFRHRITRIEISFASEKGGIKAVSIDDVTCYDHINGIYSDVYSGKNFAARAAKLVYSKEKECFALNVNAASPSLEFESFAREPEGCNSAVFCVDAGEHCTKLVLWYADENGDFSPSRTLAQNAKKGVSDYVFTFPAGVFPDRLRLVFEGARSGVIEIRSISFASVYTRGIETCGSVSGVEITADKKNVRVTGGVGYDAALAYSGSRLELYVLESYEDERDVKGKERAASLAMTSKFDFYLDMPDDFSPAKKYVVCIKNADGDPVFVDTAKYVSNCSILAPAASKDAPASKKGILAKSGESAFELDAGCVVYDITLNDLLSEKSAGYLHTQGKTYYRFDIDAVNALDKKIADACNAGAAVYLRLEGKDPDGRERALEVNDKESASLLSAVVDFLTSRYDSAKSGRLAGFIVGRKVDLANENYYSGDMPLGAFVREYARTLALVYNTARTNSPHCKIFVPVSDSFAPHDFSYASLSGGAYDKRTFLSSLASALSDIGDFDLSVFLECGEFFTDEREDAVCASNVGLFCDFLSGLYVHSFAPFGGVAFYFDTSDIPSDALGAALCYSYYACLPLPEIEAFIIKIDGAESEDIKELIRYIDTDRAAAFTAQYAGYFGADDFGEILSLPYLPEKKLYTGELVTDGYEYAGSYLLWNFDSAYSTLGWKEGIGCTGLFHVKEEGAAYISASFDRSPGSIVYVRDSMQSGFALFDALKFDIGVSGTDAAELSVIIKGGGFSFERYALLGEGDSSVIFGISDVSDAREIRSVEIRVSGGETPPTLKLYKVSGISKSMDDGALAAAMSVKTDTERPFNSMWIVIMVTLAVASVAAFFIIGKKEKEK